MQKIYESILEKREKIKSINNSLIETNRELISLDNEIASNREETHRNCMNLYDLAKYSEEEERITTIYGRKIIGPIISLPIFFLTFGGTNPLILLLIYGILNVSNYFLTSKKQERVRAEYDEYRFIRRYTLEPIQELIDRLTELLKVLLDKKDNLNAKKSNLEQELAIAETELDGLTNKLINELGPFLDQLIVADLNKGPSDNLDRDFSDLKV